MQDRQIFARLAQVDQGLRRKADIDTEATSAAYSPLTRPSGHDPAIGSYTKGRFVNVRERSPFGATNQLEFTCAFRWPLAAAVGI